MIISNSRRFVFIHVHKCAGSTLTKLLTPHTMWNDIELGVTTYGEQLQLLYRERFGLWKHAKASEVRATIGSELFDSYFKFSFVRNPVNRAVSFYTFIKKLHETCPANLRDTISTWPISKALRETQSFPEFIHHPEFVEPPMFRLLTDAPINPRKLLVDFVGKVESIESDVGFVCQKLGLPQPQYISKQNASQAERYRLNEYYSSPNDFDIIFEKFGLDFDLFNYSRQAAIDRFKKGE